MTDVRPMTYRDRLVLRCLAEMPRSADEVARILHMCRFEVAGILGRLYARSYVRRRDRYSAYYVTPLGDVALKDSRL